MILRLDQDEPSALIKTPDDIARLRRGDVLVNPATSRRPERRYIVRGWSPRGKLRMQGSHCKTESTAWWTYGSQLPKGWWIERDGERLW